jgi:hypothetical protein
MATRPHGVRFTPKADIVEFEAVSSVSFFISQAPAKRRDKQGVAVSPARRTSRSFAVGVDDLFDRLARGAIEDPKLAIGAYWLKDNIDRL